MMSFAQALESNEFTLCRESIDVVQVNVGNVCNQSCWHCHVGVGPGGRQSMSRQTADDVLRFAARLPQTLLDITGGAPELNPHLRYLVSGARGVSLGVMVRSNLTAMLEPGNEDFPEFFAQHRVELTCSLPCYTKDNVDRQRGPGVFEKSIRQLKRLNALGYGLRPELPLNLVYNPGGAFLPGRQDALEADYRRRLADDHGVIFNRLFALANLPIKRFRDYLKREGKLAGYEALLAESFNPAALPSLMCRSMVSIDWQGRLYDCDFNQALGLPERPLSVAEVGPEELLGAEILIGEHCFGCTAGFGSSCTGATCATSTGQG